MLDKLLKEVLKSKNKHIDSLNRYKESIKELEKALAYCTNLHEDPDSIDSKYLRSIVSPSLKTDDFNQMLSLVGLYKAYSYKGEAKYYLNYLKDLETKIIEEKTKELESIKEELAKTSKKIENYNITEQILKSYNDNKFIGEEELLSLYDVLSEIPLHEETYKFFSKISKNNQSIISRSQIKKEDQVPIKEEKITKKSYLEKYQDFLKDKDFLDEKTFNKINRILSGIIDVFDETKINKKEIGEIKQNLVLLKGVVDKKELLSDIFVLCVDSYEKGNKKRIKSLIEAYKYNPTVGLKEYFELEGKLDELDLLDRVESIIEKTNYDSKNVIVDYYNTYGRPTKEVIDYLVASGINVDDYKDYHYYQEIERKYKEILKEKQDGTSGIDFATKLNELESVVNSYEDLKEKREDDKTEKETIIDGLNPSDPYNENDCNFLIFFDQDRYLQIEQELLRKHPDVITRKTFQRKCNKLINKPIGTILTDDLSRNIHSSKGKPNKDNVRELRRGSIRMGFKVLDNAEIDGHKVIAVLLASYGQTDGTLKQKGLQSSLGMYEKDLDRAKHLERIFSKDATEEERKEARQMIEKFKNYYKGFSNDNKKEK